MGLLILDIYYSFSSASLLDVMIFIKIRIIGLIKICFLNKNTSSITKNKSIVARPKPIVRLPKSSANQNPTTRPIKINNRKNKNKEIIIHTNEPNSNEEDRIALSL
jgi:hypothetical protein